MTKYYVLLQVRARGRAAGRQGGRAAGRQGGTVAVEWNTET